MNWTRTFQQPFPDRADHGKNLLSLVGVGVFVTLFLWILRPFGLSDVRDGLLPICLGFGLVTVVFGWMYDALFRFVLRVRTDLPSWTLSKWILQSIGLLVWVAVGNFLYMNVILGFHGADTGFLFQMIINTALVGIFPIVFSGLTIQLKAARMHRTNAEELQPQLAAHHPMADTTIGLSSAAEQSLEVHTHAIRYVEAMQNYVCVYYISENELKKEVQRETIANMEARLSGTAIVRCHRSYLVNVDCIAQVSGNAQGLKLRLTDVPEPEVPVSRSYITALRQLL